MSFGRSALPWEIPWPLLLGVVVLLAGCGTEAGIRRYTVDKPRPRDRMLAAIVPHDRQAWFFKVTGPNATVAAEKERFLGLMDTLRFDGEQPAWELPEPWRQQPGSGMRFATIEIPSGEEVLELTVTSLPLPQTDLDAYVLSNVNRWRQQLQRSPIAEDRLVEESQSLALADATATVVDIEGNLGSTPDPMAPFAGGGSARGPFASSGAPPEPEMTYDQPEGWSEGQKQVSRGGISIRRAAAFQITDSAANAEVTVTTLPAAAGDFALNVNRWREQIGLSAVSPDELASEVSTMGVAGTEGQYVELVGSEQAILGVIATRGEHAWFIKLQGDRDLAVRERDRFRQFVESIQIEP